MKTTKTMALALAGLIAAAVATGAAAALAPGGFFMVGDDGGKGKGKVTEQKVEVKSRETVEIVVSGADGKPETIKIEDLAPGQSKEIRSASGKKATVKRGVNGYTVQIDGKEIVVEVDDDGFERMGSGRSCLPELREMRRRGRGAGHATGCCCCGFGGGMGHVRMGCGAGGGRAFEFELDDDDDDRKVEKFVWRGHGASTDEDLLMELCERGAGAGSLMFIGEGGRIPGRVDAADLDKLDAMKGVDAKTREKIQAVLEELESKSLREFAEGPVVIRKKVVVDGPDGDGPDEKQVKMIVIRERDDEKPVEKKDGKK